MKMEKSHIVGTAMKSNNKIVERGKSTPQHTNT